jgi:monovalent cation:H+ antiporter-2, CPA2 family
LDHAAALVISLPDSKAVRVIISQAKRICPDLPVVARVRYHIHMQSLVAAGSDHLVDEEALAGERLGSDIVHILRARRKDEANVRL